MNSNSSNRSFFDHLAELRSRVVKCAVIIALTSCVAYSFVDQVLAFFIQPIGHVVFTAPAEAFAVRINLTILVGFIFSLPFVLYHAWQFVAAGLKEHEKKYIIAFGPFSLICFLAGAVFGYFVMVPISMKFFLGFSSPWVIPMITVNHYISFVGSMIMAFGIVFELPLVLLFLTKIGIATPAFLIQKRRHAVVLILIVSAILTPPDVVSQFLMAAPLLILYEIGILVSKITYRQMNVSNPFVHSSEDRKQRIEETVGDRA